jgi:hypothetical protein
VYIRIEQDLECTVYRSIGPLPSEDYFGLQILYVQYTNNIPFETYAESCSDRAEIFSAALQAHLLSVVNKIRWLLEHQGVLHYLHALAFLGRLSDSLLHD